MNRAELGAAVIVLAVGGTLLAAALRFPFFLDGVPGPGFLPLLVSFGIVGTGLALLARTVRAGSAGGEAVRWAPRAGWRRMAIMTGALAACLLLLDVLGFIVVTTLFMAVMIFALGERSWRMLATVPVLSAAALYAVFAVWLRVPLPKGVITFLG